MGKIRKLLGVLIALSMVLSTAAMAAEESYTYTVRIFAGRQGTIAGGEVLTYTDLHYGDRISFQQSSVSLNDDSKYYIRGIRESGKDNDTALATASFTVTGDADYVVCYALLGSSVAYTVRYVDADGNELAPDETYYGNVGDRPVIAYLYIDGYRPQAYNLTGELLADASQNVFTFTYTPGTAAVPGGAGAAGAAGTAGTAGGAGAGAGQTGGAADGAAAGADGAQDGAAAEQPAELESIRDEEIPRAAGDGSGSPLQTVGEFAKKIPTPAKAAVAAVGGAVIVALAWLLLIHRRRRSERDE